MTHVFVWSVDTVVQLIVFGIMLMFWLLILVPIFWGWVKKSVKGLFK